MTAINSTNNTQVQKALERKHVRRLIHALIPDPTSDSIDKKHAPKRPYYLRYIDYV